MLAHALLRADHLRTPEFSEVCESGIPGANEVKFLLSAPTFELLLASDGRLNLSEFFVIEEAGAAVGFGEPFKGSIAMLRNARI